MPPGRKVAVVGGGWAGLAAAVEATRCGARVTVFEMARQLGGRARGLTIDGFPLDNGQHICIGAYTETLRLMRDVGVTEDQAFLRMPLRLEYPDRSGLRLRGGPAPLAFSEAVLRHRTWTLREKTSLLMAAARWAVSGFRCDPALTVARLAQHLPKRVRDDVIDPLCVAALNTRAEVASAAVFLRVLGDALFSAPGSADLLLPRVSLGDALPAPAARWLTAAGASVRIGHRVVALGATPTGFEVDGERFDGVVLATPPSVAAGLTRLAAPAWSNVAEGLRYEPIVTVYLHSAGTMLPAPMLALRSDAASPAQFVFDRGQLGGPPGLLAFVISGAADWVEAGTAPTLEATCRQAESALGPLLCATPKAVQVVTEKRATLRCTPELRRPIMEIAPNLVAAGDYVDGPYPSTLEGAVRAGIAAARSLSR